MFSIDLFCHLSFSFEIKEPSDGKYGALHKNGTWSGIIGQLSRNVKYMHAIQTKVHFIVQNNIFLQMYG